MCVRLGIISYLFACIVCYGFSNKKYIYNSPTQKYQHVLAKEDPQARIVGGRAVHDGSQL